MKVKIKSLQECFKISKELINQLHLDIRIPYGEEIELDDYNKFYLSNGTSVTVPEQFIKPTPKLPEVCGSLYVTGFAYYKSEKQFGNRMKISVEISFNRQFEEYIEDQGRHLNQGFDLILKPSNRTVALKLEELEKLVKAESNPPANI